MTNLTWHRDDELQRSVSEPPGYVVEWRRTTVGGPLFFNAWYLHGNSRVSICGDFDGQKCRDACQSHFDARQPSFDALKPTAEGNTR